ncbi:MAG: T9SS type A sorting domain-containing protein [Sphingobacteriales bacterium]|nr:MAG: T9SS type A sorting domain-containing protein [Sphingobacteriales bacterium]
MSRTNSNIIYLSSASGGGATYGQLDAVYRSEDGGDNWTVIAKGDANFNPLASQGYYDHCIAVDPKNPDRVIIGGLNIWEGKIVNSRFQWTQLTNWSFEEDGFGGINPYYVHADQHIFKFDKSEVPILYIGSDGGISKSVDFTYTNKPTFKNSDYGFNTVQFYGIGVSASNPNEVIGGTQDNGVLLVKGGGLTLLNSDKIRGGDGGFSEISKINPNVYFGEYVYGDLYRSFTKGKNWSNFFDDNIPKVGQPRYPFVTIFSLWESLNDPTAKDSIIFKDEDSSYKSGAKITLKNPSGYIYNITLNQSLPKGTAYKIQDVVQSRFFVGAVGEVWVTRQALVSGVTPTFFKIATIPGFVPHDIRHSKDGNTVFVSGARGSSGEIYRITGLSGKNFEYTNGVFKPQDYDIKTTLIYTKDRQVATGIAVDENNANHVIATFGAYGFTDHVYRTKDALNEDELPTFTNISSNLPDFPVYDALINMTNANEYLIAGEYGVWSSRNGGATWKEENEGMERVPTFMLRQMKFGNEPWAKPVFYAATHGRGVFRTTTLTGIDDEDKAGKDAQNNNLTLYPNPAQSFANVTFDLGKAGDVEIMIVDIQGRVAGRFNYAKQLAGERTYKLETSNLKAGTYFVKVSSQGISKTAKMLIMK